MPRVIHMKTPTLFCSSGQSRLQHIRTFPHVTGIVSISWSPIRFWWLAGPHLWLHKLKRMKDWDWFNGRLDLHAKTPCAQHMVRWPTPMGRSSALKSALKTSLSPRTNRSRLGSAQGIRTSYYHNISRSSSRSAPLKLKVNSETGALNVVPYKLENTNKSSASRLTLLRTARSSTTWFATRISFTLKAAFSIHRHRRCPKLTWCDSLNHWDTPGRWSWRRKFWNLAFAQYSFATMNLSLPLMSDRLDRERPGQYGILHQQIQVRSLQQNDLRLSLTSIKFMQASTMMISWSSHKAGDGFLQTDFGGFELPHFITEAVNVQRIQEKYDRWLICTDGTSQSKLRRLAPLHADELGSPDAWAMLVLGEKLLDDGATVVEPIGWCAHPVLYDPKGTGYAHATRIGAEVAEREALIWAGIWRLTQNCSTPTVFCCDSLSCGNQAFGNIGAGSPDEAYRLLRGIFQCLEHGLPKGHLRLHHIRSHAGDPFNEFVDYAARREAKTSFHPQTHSHWHSKIAQNLSTPLAHFWTPQRTFSLERWSSRHLFATVAELMSPWLHHCTTTGWGPCQVCR